MIIKVLGPGCAKCKTTYALIEKVAHELNLSPIIEKVEDIQAIMKYDILTTPAVVIDEVVRIKGRVPTEAEIRGFLK